LEQAASGFDASEMALHAAAARWRHAELAGDADRKAAAEACMAREGMLNPARFTRMLTPGFDRLC
jgi:eukaryotic-like serine/threonine-protein kinase